MTRNDSQWAAQFAVAAKLVRGGYSVAFYHGNEPLHDMPVRGRKSANQFVLQIKGTQRRPPQKPHAHGPDTLVGKLQTGNLTDLFVIVYTPPAAYAGGQNPEKLFRFFIAIRHELQAISNPRKQHQQFT